MDKKGIGYLTVALIIIVIVAAVTLLVIFVVKPGQPTTIVTSPELLEQSLQHGCDVKNGMNWCAITQTCINAVTEKCEIVVVTDSHGCLVNQGDTWCEALTKCIKPNSGETCVAAQPAPVNNTPPPVITPPVLQNLTPPVPVENESIPLPPVLNETINETLLNETEEFINPNTTFNGNMT